MRGSGNVVGMVVRNGFDAMTSRDHLAHMRGRCAGAGEQGKGRRWVPGRTERQAIHA